MDDAVQRPFTTFDGHNLAVYDWALPTRQRPRGVVLIVHGLGEHAWRYEPLASTLQQWGFVVRAYDQRGHGDSAGALGCIPLDGTLVLDLAEVIDDTRAAWCRPWSSPLMVLGHSLGGLVASLLVSQRLRRIEGLVLSSPALRLPLGPVDRLLLAVLPRWLPNLAVGNGLNPSHVSRDPVVVQAYKRDPRVHDRVSPRLAQFMVRAGAEVLANAHEWVLPTLLLYAGSDLLVDPEGSRELARLVPPEVLTTQAFEGLFHEIFNEPERDLVLAALQHWLDQRFPRLLA